MSPDNAPFGWGYVVHALVTAALLYLLIFGPAIPSLIRHWRRTRRVLRDMPLPPAEPSNVTRLEGTHR